MHVIQLLLWLWFDFFSIYFYSTFLFDGGVLLYTLNAIEHLFFLYFLFTHHYNHPPPTSIQFQFLYLIQ